MKQENHQEEQQDTSLSKRLYNFYTGQFENIIRLYKRGPAESLCLKIIYALQILSLLFAVEYKRIIQSNIDNQILETLITVLNDSKIIPLIQSAFSLSEDLTAFVYATLFINLVAVVYVLLRLAVALLGYNKTLAQWRAYDQTSSFFFQIYLHVLTIPFFEICMKSFYDKQNISLAIMNIALIIVIGIVLTIHDFEYCYILRDFLAKRESIANLLFFFSDMVLCALIEADIGQIIFWVHLLFIGYRVYDFNIQVTYYYPEVSTLYLQLNFVHIMITIMGLLFEFQTIQEKFDLSIVILWIIPICMKLGANFRRYRLRNVRLLRKQDIDSSITLDLYVREINILTNLDYKNYADGENGVIFEKLFTTHVLECDIAFSATKTCYCERFQKLNSELTQEEFMDAAFRRGFLLFYIIDTYNEFFLKNKLQHDSTKLRFSFIAFLIEIFNLPTKALTEVMYMKVLNTTASIKEKYVTHQFIRQADIAFFSFFNNSPILNQRLDMMSSMQFDQTLSQLKKDIQAALFEKRDYFGFLCQDTVDLNQLSERGMKMTQHRDNVESLIMKINEINPQSRYCIEMAQLYLTYFDCQLRNLKSFRTKSKTKHNILKTKQEIDIDLFSEEACIIFITLLKPIGQIKRTTTSITKIFGYTKEEVVNQNISLLMPDDMGFNHDRFLQWFLNNDRMSSIKKGQVFGFIKFSDGFIHPMYKRLRIDTFENDFGVSGYIELTNAYYDYMRIDDKNIILEMTRKIYNSCFRLIFSKKQNELINEAQMKRMRLQRRELRKLLDYKDRISIQEQIRKIDASLLIPYLLCNEMEAQDADEGKQSFVTTLLIFPLTSARIRLFQKRPGDAKVHLYHIIRSMNFLEFGLVSITFRKCLISTSLKGLSYYHLEIINRKRLRKTKDKMQILDQFSNQIKSLLKVRFREQGKSLVSEFDEDEEFLANNQVSVTTGKNYDSIAQDKQENEDSSDEDDGNHKHTKFQSEHAQTMNKDPKNSQDDRLDDENIVIEETTRDQHRFNFESNANKLIEYSKYQKEIIGQPVGQPNNQALYTDVNQTQEGLLNQSQNQNVDGEGSALNDENIHNKDSNRESLNQQSSIKNDKQNELLLLLTQTERRPATNQSGSDKDNAGIPEASSEIQHPIKQINSSTENKFTHQESMPHQNSLQKIGSMQKQESEIRVSSAQIDNVKKPIVSSQQQTSSFVSKNTTESQKKGSNSSMHVNIIDDLLQSQQNRSLATSTSTELHLQKVNFVQAIHSTNWPRLMIKLNLVGLVSLIILIATTVLLFILTKQNFNQEIDTFQQIVVSTNLMSEFGQMYKENEFQRIVGSNANKDQLCLLNNPSDPRISGKLTKANELAQSVVKVFQTRISQIIDEKRSFDYQKYIKEQLTILYQININKEVTQKVVEMIYYFLQIPNYAFDYAINDMSTDTNSRIVMYYNFVNIIRWTNEVFKKTHQQPINILSQTKTLLNVSVVILLLLIVFVTSLSIPFYLMVQYKREEILKMFATFPENKLKEKIEFYNLALNQFSDDIDYKKQFQGLYQNQHKRKAISMTTSLDKFNPKIIIGMSLLLIVLSIYPIVNYVITNGFIEEFTKNVNELSLTYFMKGNTAINYATNYLYISCKVQNCSQDYLFTPLKDYMKELTVENQDKLSQLQFMAKNFQGTNRYGQEDYESIFLRALQINICDTLKENQDKLASARKIDYEECTKVYSGILQKGLIMTLITIHQRFEEISQSYQVNLQQFKNDFKQFDQSVDFLGLDDVFLYVIDIIEMIRDFLLAKAQEYFDKQISIQSWLFAYAIFCMAVIFFYGWYKFISHINQQWYMTRYIIGIFQLDMILANPYMIAMLEKQKFK